jgi:hypothetical protein
LKRVFARTQLTATIAALSALLSMCNTNAAELAFPVSGEILGSVTDAAGIPQMGASVQLFNKYQQFLARTLTNVDGRFAFGALPADNYSVRVSLASFLPAARDRVAVKVGLDSVLEIHLATLLSRIEVSYRVPSAAMSEDWKWVLRSSPATRPINRILVDSTQQAGLKPHVFSGTHALISVSGGDNGLIDSNDVAADLGTSFALSTRVLGNNQVQFAGTVGQNPQFGPAAVALSAVYSRTEDSPFASPPEVTLSMQQLGGIGTAINTGGGNGSIVGTPQIPVLRAMSLNLYQVADPLDNVHVEYGAKGETVEYGQHINRVSPFARVTVNLSQEMAVIAAFSDGGSPDALTAHQQYQQAELEGRPDDLSGSLQSISRLPQIANSDNRLQLERTQSYDLGISKTAGSRTFSASGFYEKVSNGRLNVTGDLSMLNSGYLFSDGVSTTSLYNFGRYNRPGFLGSINQRVNDSLDVELAYGRMGGFTENKANIASGDWSGARFLEQRQSSLASLNVKAKVPHSGTRISAGYGWSDPHTAIPLHTFTTQNVSAMPGLNILVRQPVPSPFGVPGHFELTADLRNLMAAGYMPMSTADGRTLLVVEVPRAIRGGLRITF